MKKLSAVLTLAFLMAAAPLSAQSDWSWNLCGGNAFETCSSGNVAYEYNATGGYYTISVFVTNLVLQNSGELFKAIGLFNIPKTGVSSSAVSGPTGYYEDPPMDISGAGLTKDTKAWVANKQDYMLGYSGSPTSGTFTFRLTGITATQLTNVGVGIHAIAGTTGCSNKIGIKNGALIAESDPTRNGGYAGCAPTVVPEPTTVVLLGTGLIGLFGVGYWRRREEDEA